MNTVRKSYRPPLRGRLDAKLIKALKPRDRSYICWDTEVKGLGVRVTPNGHKAFVLQYRTNGRERRMTIGEYGTWTAKVARDEARSLKLRVDQGEDPLQDEQDERSATTVNALIERYREDALPDRRKETQRSYERNLVDIAKAFGRRKVKDIRMADIDKLHKSRRRTPAMANRTLAVASVLFGKAVKWELIDRNPCSGVERFPEEPRERLLSKQEMARLAGVLEDWPHEVAAACLLFMLLTGCRKGEALSMGWEDVNFDDGIWTKPSHHTKQKRVHRVPLSNAALEILGGLDGERPFRCDLTHEWAKIRKAAGLEDVRMHDLRHQHASLLAASGKSLPEIGALLGHTQPATTARYTHFFDAPLREGAEGVAEKWAAAGKSKSKIVKFPKSS